MRPLTPKGPAGGGMPGPVVNRPMSRSGPGPGPVVNRPMSRSGNVPVKLPPPGMRMKKGGSASSRADGVAKRGKTKGKFV